MLIVGVQQPGGLDDLSARERAVLELMAQGRSNAAICRELWLSRKTVESHVRSIFRKLGLEADDGTHRRVRAVLAWLAAAVVSEDQASGARTPASRAPAG